MIFIILKLGLLIMIYNVYTKVNKVMVPAVAWAIFSFFMPGQLKGLDISIFITTGMVFIVAYGIFALAKYFSTSMWELVIMVLGIVILWIM